MTVSFHLAPQQTNKCEYTAESRSTSAGSRQSGEQHRYSGLPEYEYPVPVFIRNTFIETKVGRPVSLDEFFEERRIQSCPAVPPEREDCDSDIKPPVNEPLRRASTAEAHEPLRGAMAAGADMSVQHLQSAYTRFLTGFRAEPEIRSSAVSSRNCSTRQQGNMPRILMLSEALPEAEPELGSMDLPTLGSAGHYVGACKPCAFFHTKGCANGTQCSFCHLCPSDEKRTRQKEKQAAFCEIRRQRRQVRL